MTESPEPASIAESDVASLPVSVSQPPVGAPDVAVAKPAGSRQDRHRPGYKRPPRTQTARQKERRLGRLARQPSRFKRPYRRSGLYRAQLSPEDQAVIDGVRDALVADCGGADNLSTARRLLIDLAAAAAIRCQRVNDYRATLDSLVDKRMKREWIVVSDARRAEAHLQALLRDIGLDRVAAPVLDIRRQHGLD